MTVSKRLAERLSGTGPETKDNKRKLTKREQETLALMKEDDEIRSALIRTKRVGKLLLKREDEELAKLDDLVQELIQAPGLNPTLAPDPCKESRQACEECCNQTTQDSVLKCKTQIENYTQCVNFHFNKFLN